MQIHLCVPITSDSLFLSTFSLFVNFRGELVIQDAYDKTHFCCPNLSVYLSTFNYSVYLSIHWSVKGNFQLWWFPCPSYFPLSIFMFVAGLTLWWKISSTLCLLSLFDRLECPGHERFYLFVGNSRKKFKAWKLRFRVGSYFYLSLKWSLKILIIMSICWRNMTSTTKISA